MIHFIIGGARSGKSAFAQRLSSAIQVSENSCVKVIATATACDEEMARRISVHKAERPQNWQTIEEPLALAKRIDKELPGQLILVDCLTLWLNNQLHSFPEQNFKALFSDLIGSITSTEADIVMVANEVGLGVIPMGELSRSFVDEAGRLNQKIAEIADSVTFMAAGLPMYLKGEHNVCKYLH